MHFIRTITYSNLADCLTVWLQALVIAKRSVADPNIRERHTSLTNSLAGVIFLGTPHAGSGYSTIGKLYCLFNYWQGASTMLLRYMDPGSKETREVEDEFLSGYDEVPSIDYYESRPNIILGFRVNLVSVSERAHFPNMHVTTPLGRNRECGNPPWSSVGTT